MPMFAARRARLASAILAAGMIAVVSIGAATGQTMAQGEPRAAPSLPPLQRLPDGFVVTPSRPLQEALPPGAGDGAAPSESGRRQVPRHQPHGGCRYDEQKLDLIV